MSESPKVSVVMPVYNGEKYLREAIDGVLSQTLTDFELICIDDGSTDNTASILDGYAGVDNRVRVLHRENAGVSAARNLGITQARGKYLTFFDDDDLFEPDMLEKMVSKMERCDADVCIPNGYKLDAADNNRIIKAKFINTKFVPDGEWFSPRDAGKYLLNFPTFYIYKMYRTDFLRKHGIEFGNQRAEEDALFFTKALLVADRITVVNDRLFYYRVNTGDSVSDLIFQRDMLAGCESMLIVKELMQELDMFDDPDYHQSYVNRALTKTMNYRSRTKDFSSLKALYDRMVLCGGLEEMDLLGHKADYFYNQKHFDELVALENSEAVEEYLYYLFDTARSESISAKRKITDLRRDEKEARRQLRQEEKAYKELRNSSIRVSPSVKRILSRIKHLTSK